MLTPWNFPLLQSAVKVAAAMAAGCTMIIKPSTICPLTTIRLGDLANAAGVPAGVLNILPGTGSEVGTAISGHPGLSKVSFTGSEDAGRRVAIAASGQINPVAMELGGKGAILVFDDVDV